jgi:hypothetical protein
MAFREIKEKLEKSYVATQGKRFRDLDAYDRMLDGTFYEHIKTPFEQEKDSQGHYIRLSERRPSTPYNLPEIISQDCSALMFGDDHCPAIRCREIDSTKPVHTKTQDAIDELVEDLHFFERMMQVVPATFSGSSCVIVYCDPDGQPWFEVTRGKYCTPYFDNRFERKLTAVERVFDLDASTVESYGYRVPQDQREKKWWMRIVTDQTYHYWYAPLYSDDFARLGDDDGNGGKIEWAYDDRRSYPHRMKCVPVVWVKTPGGNRIDGRCVFGKVVDICVKLDYLLSQVCRAIEYSSDPTLAIMRDALSMQSPLESGGTGPPTDRTGAAVRDILAPLELGKEGDAKLLEITGGGIKIALDLLKRLREWGMEVVGGMKADQDHSTAAPQSGRALEILYVTLVWLIEALRKPFAQCAQSVIRIILTAAKDGPVKLETGNDGIDPDVKLECHWPSWHKPQGQDLLNEVKAWQIAAGASDNKPRPLLPDELIMARLVAIFGETDISGAIHKLEEQIEEDRKQNLAQLQAETNIETQAQVEIAKAKPAAPVGAGKAS